MNERLGVDDFSSVWLVVRLRAEWASSRCSAVVLAILALFFVANTSAWAAGPAKAKAKAKAKAAHRTVSARRVSPGGGRDLRNACRHAFFSNDYAGALRIGLRALDKNPKDTYVLGLVGVAACKLGDLAVIKTIWPRISPSRRPLLEQACLQNGITRRRGKFVDLRHRSRKSRSHVPRRLNEVKRVLRAGSRQSRGARSHVSRRADYVTQILQVAADPTPTLTRRMLGELRSCFPPPLMAPLARYGGVWVVLLDLMVARSGRVARVRLRIPPWRYASLCLACLRVATKRWRFALRPKPTTLHHLLRIRPLP